MNLAAQHKNKNKKGNHDDCEDCRRQKSQNNALISIYERLQGVRGRAKSVKDSLDFHMNQSLVIGNKVKDIEKQCKEAPYRSYSIQQVKELGFTLASRVFENKLASKVEQENSKLRETIRKMQKQRNAKLHERSLRQRMRNTSHQLIQNGLYLGNSTSQSANFPSPNNAREGHVNRISLTRGSNINAGDNLWKEISSTKSSDFRQPKSREIKQQANQQEEPTNYQMLKSSLWLYENEKNNKLEQQLLDTSKPSRYQRSKPVRRGVVLPAVKTLK